MEESSQVPVALIDMTSNAKIIQGHVVGWVVTHSNSERDVGWVTNFFVLKKTILKKAIYEKVVHVQKDSD